MYSLFTHHWGRTGQPTAGRFLTALIIGIGLMLAAGAGVARANVPAAIVSSTAAAVTLTDNGSTVTLSNGIVSILCTKSDANITQINYTYNNGTSTQTKQLLNGGTDGGKLYWEYGGFGGDSCTYSVAVNPSTGDANHPAGDYGEIDMLSSSGTNGTVDMHFSMLRGSPGFYVTAIWSHRSVDTGFSLGETRTNIYAGSLFNWMSVDPGRNKLMAVSTGNVQLPVPGAPVECYLWANGIYQGLYDDKYKYSADFGDEQYTGTPGPHRVWGWSSVGTGGINVGLWDVNASQEYYNCGPMKRELMCHIGTTILNMFNGDHYAQGMDAQFASGEVWTKVYGPYFVYCNNVAASVTDPYQASQTLYNDAVAQGIAEASGTASTAGAAIGATAWPYGWFVNGNYTPASGRGTVTGRIIVSDTGNPTASGSNMLVGLVQQPATSAGTYDFQAWMKPYQFWVHADGNGNFSIPNVISGANYTLYAFGPGAEGEFMSQNQTGGNPPVLHNLPATPFGVTVTGGSTTALGNITWTPTRVGATVFEIGYPDRTSRKFRHGDDFWVGDIGPSATSPAPVWTKYLEYPFDYPNGMSYNVGTSRWNTDWDFVEPVLTATNFTYNNPTSTITFTLPSKPANNAQASFYIGLASNLGDATILTLNGYNLGNTSGVTTTPNSDDVNGYYSSYGNCDSTIREGNNALFSDERITFPASLLNSGTNINTLTITMRQAGGTYFADHIMFDYLRMELTGYVPPAPGSVTAWPGNGSMLVSWPVTPGATTYNISRSITTGSNYTTIATGVTGPVCGSGYNNATWLDTTATNGTTYYYVVQSANTTGTSSNSPQSTGAAPSSGVSGSAPAAPTNVTATAGNAQVNLSWSASSGANYYIVRRSVYALNGGTILGGLANSSEDYNLLGTITLTNTTIGASYTDATPTNGSTYSYSVAAVNASGTSSAGSSSNAVPLAPAPTTAPTVTATPGDQEVTLTWNAVPNAVGYVVEAATAPGGPYTLLASVTALTYTYSGLGNNTPYYFEVVATNAGGSSGNSSVAGATTALGPPASLTATPGNTQVTLNWKAVTGGTSYSVQRSTTTGGPYTAVGTSLGTSYTDNALTNGTTYYYVVATTSSNGTGPNSAEASATPASNVPIAPASLTAMPGNAQVVLNWTPSVGATNYIIREATNSGGPYTLVNSLVTGTTYTDTGLGNGTVYYFVVAASGTGGVSSNSNEASASPNGNLSLSWYGGVSTAWDTVTANWIGSSGSTDYVAGDSVTFSDAAATSTVLLTSTYDPTSVTFNNSVLTYTESGANGGMITGATGLVKTGSGNLILSDSNTFTGSTAIIGGTLTLASRGALLGSTLNYNDQGGTLSFGALTSSTFGGIEGEGSLALTNTGNAAVALVVGYNGQSTTYSGGLSGSGGSLTKLGAGTLALTGSNSYTGATTTSNGILSISAGGVVAGTAANVTGGQLQINGGSLTSSAYTNISAGSGGLQVNAGMAAFNGGLGTDAEYDNNIYVGVAGGVLNTSSLFLGRSGLDYTAEPGAGAIGTGLYVNGGAANITGQLDVCTSSQSNSSGSVRIDSGSLTVGSTTYITLDNGGRWSVLDINGGAFTSNDSTGAGIQLGGVFAGENAVMLVRNGMAYTNKITFGDTSQTSGEDVLNITGGALYVGSGGIVLGGTGAYGYSISLSGTGMLGALANWSSSLGMVLGGDSIDAGDASGDSYNITLSGALTGSALVKSGNGTLTLAGRCSYSGATTVSAGILEITGTEANTNSLIISNGATLYLASGGSLSVSGGITNNGIFKMAGTPSLALTGSFINNGVLDLINGPSTLPPNFVNNGTVLAASNVIVQNVALSGSSFTLNVQSYVEHTYQLQSSPSLTNPAWINVGSSQAGTGGTLQFTDTSATGVQKFYQVVAGP
jgi:autotransporter-associated beta strand protein